MTVGVDVGGTFTDLVRWDGSDLLVAKVTTTADQSEGVVEGMDSVGASATVIHGTTVATNALLERRGAEVVLVADEGFTDLLDIDRQDRPSLYDPFADRPPALVPVHRRVAGGTRGGPRDVAAIVEAVRGLRPEAVAVAFLDAHLDASGEEAVTAGLGVLGVPVSRSSEVAPEPREVERTSTTVVNAFLTPEMAGYLLHLGEALTTAGSGRDLLVMRSSGGLMAPEAVAALPVAALLSGPAAGVVAAAALGEALGDDALITFDMGGTSTDVCRVATGNPEVRHHRKVAGVAVQVPTVAVHTVGAGGGSLAWVDPGGALRVGPSSAGSRPGPVAYGRGGEVPTVTDADVVLGAIPADARLGGSVPLDHSSAMVAMAALGARLGMGTMAVAEGVREVVGAVMERAVRTVSLEEGADPRTARLVAFGGAGGLHGVALARRLGMRGVVVPPHAGVFSAMGLLLAPPRHDVARSVRPGDDAAIAPALALAVEEAKRGLTAMGSVVVDVVAGLDVRYVGQGHETHVPMDPDAPIEGALRRFHDVHRTRNGFASPESAVEVVTVRAAALGAPALRWSDLPEHRHDDAVELGTRPLVVDGRTVDATAMHRSGLAVGAEVRGPAIILDDTGTTLLGPGDVASVHPTGALEVTW